MNEISSHSLQTLTLRASGVKSKPNAKSADKAGNNLPPAANVEKDIVVKTPAKQSKAVSTKAMQENVKAAIAEMSKYTQSIQRDIQFDIDDTSGRTVVSVLDRETQEVIRQIPDETFLKLARKLKEDLAAGDQTAFHFMSAKA